MTIADVVSAADPATHSSLPPETIPSTTPDRFPFPAPDVELLGEFDGGGTVDPTYLVQKNGQVLQLTQLIYTVLAACDGNRTLSEVSAAVAASTGVEIDIDGIEYLLDEKLAPLGLTVDLTQPRGSVFDPPTSATVTTSQAGAPSAPAPGPSKAPILGIRFRVRTVPKSVVRPVARLFSPLFHPLLVVAAVAAFLAIDVWLFTSGAVGDGFRQTLFDPYLILVMLGMIVVSGVFHEVGHAAACHYGGGRPGAMGAGLYLFWPVFYTDVTDAYRLSRRARVRTDLGGVYFNVLFALALTTIYAFTGFEPLLVLVAIQNLEILQQFIPFARFDGYWTVGDLAGIPDLFHRMGPALRSLRPGRPIDPGLADLRPWPRRIVMTWAAITFPVLFVNLSLAIWLSPSIFRTGFDALEEQFSMLDASINGGAGWVIGVLAGVSVVLVALPLVALSLTAVWISWSVGGLLARGRRRFRLAQTLWGLLLLESVVVLSLTVDLL